jgi:hypothetical protein
MLGRLRQSAQARNRVFRAQHFTAPVGAFLQLDLTAGQPLRPDKNLPGNADEVGCGEF